MTGRARFFLSGTVFFFSVSASLPDLVPGTNYSLSFVDVDGQHFSTIDGRITLIVLATSGQNARARTVGDHVPDYCLADPNYRMITVLNLSAAYSRLARPLAIWLIRQRLNAEAKQLQKRYDAKKIERDARRDLFAVADFDGTVTSQLGETPQASQFRVFVFGRDGKLLHEWNDVPSAAELDAALRQGRGAAPTADAAGPRPCH
jgi:hypothetical protein